MSKEDKKAEEPKKAEEAKTEEKKPTNKLTKLLGRVSKIVLIVVGGFIAMIIALIVWVNIATSGASKVSDEFIQHMQDNNAVAGYNLLTESAKESVSQAQLGAVFERLSGILVSEPTKTGKEISTGSNRDDISSITYKMEGNDGVTYDVEVYLIDTEDGWLVEAFNSSDRENNQQ